MFAVAAVVYTLAASVAPVLHLVDDGGVHDAAARAASSGEPGEPLPLPDPLGDPDCLVCQVLTSAAHPVADGPPREAPSATHHAPGAESTLRLSAAARLHLARAPPSA